MARSTSNSNQRGSSQARARRRQHLVDEYGDGEKVQCSFCPTLLTVETVTPDRIIPGCEGGTYRKDNIRPSCLPCACKQGGKIGSERKRQMSIVKKGDRFLWGKIEMFALRAAKDQSWADFYCIQKESGLVVAEWSKRHSLPLSKEFVRREE